MLIFADKPDNKGMKSASLGLCSSFLKDVLKQCQLELRSFKSLIADYLCKPSLRMESSSYFSTKWYSGKKYSLPYSREWHSCTESGNKKACFICELVKKRFSKWFLYFNLVFISRKRLFQNITKRFLHNKIIIF